jgi:membrane protease YdiL (CAAX protease family)
MDVSIPESDEVSAPAPSVGRAWGVLGAYLGCQFLVQALLGAVIGARIAVESGGSADADAFAAALQALAGPGACVAGAIAGLAVVRMAWRPRRRGVVQPAPSWLAPTRFDELSAPAAAGILLGVAYVWGAGALYAIDASMSPGPLAAMAEASPSKQWLWALFALLCAPAIEEILFRGVLLTALQRAWGTLCAAVVVTSVFVMLHAGEAVGYPPALAAIGGVGLLTLGIRIRTGKVAPAISAHAGYNLVIVLHALVR